MKKKQAKSKLKKEAERIFEVDKQEFDILKSRVERLERELEKQKAKKTVAAR